MLYFLSSQVNVIAYWDMPLPYLQKHLPGFAYKSQKHRGTLFEKLAWRTAPVIMLLLLLSLHVILFTNYIISYCNTSTPCERQEEMAYTYPSPRSLLITDVIWQVKKANAGWKELVTLLQRMTLHHSESDKLLKIECRKWVTKAVTATHFKIFC